MTPTRARLLSNNQGSVLVIGMLTLILLSLIGVSATTTSSIEVQIAGNDKAAKEAFYAAELGLSMGERTTQAFTTRVDLNEGSVPGRYGRGTQPNWHSMTWSASDTATIQSSAMPSGLQNVATPPRFAIEERTFIRTGTLTIGTVQPTGIYLFNVTSRGVGSNSNAEVVLQSVYAMQFN